MSSATAATETIGDATAGVGKARLFGLRGSPPSYSCELMLRRKGIPYRRVNLLPGRHRRTLPRKGFPGGTVPALRLGGRFVQTNRAIARALDELVPEPPLFPADPAARAQVEDAERLGDEVLQQATRRMVLWSLSQDPDSVRPPAVIGALQIPRTALLRAPLLRRAFKLYGVTEGRVREDFEALPETLDKLDGYVAAGVLNASELTAADFEIAPLIATLLGLADLAADIAERPVAALASRVLPR